MNTASPDRLALLGRVAALTALLTSAALVSTGCAPESADAETAPTTRSSSPFTGVPLVPASGVYLGAYYGDRPIAATDAAIGRTPQVHLTYFGWNDRWTTDPALAADRGRGQISLVNWEPFDVRFEDILSGRSDAMLTRRATEAARLPKKVFLDFAAEMNEEEGWGGHDPKLYIAVWRHIHDIFAKHDGGKVVWVWAPNNTDSDGAPSATAYYPGAAYVDWVGIDGYNWGTSDRDFDWQSFTGVFGDMYDRLHRYGKPVVIGETASAETGGSKAGWLRGVAPTLRTRFPDIRALVWFDVKKERDWRIRSSAGSEQAFHEFAADSLFSAKAP